MSNNASEESELQTHDHQLLHAHQLGFHESPICMLQLGSRQGMLDLQLGFGEQSCNLGEGTTNT